MTLSHPWWRLGAALTLGTGGATLAAWFHIPLAFMIGSMLATTSAAIAGFRYTMPAPLRSGMIAVLGVMLGSAFRPELFQVIGQWGPSLLGLLLFMVLATGSQYLFYRRVAGYDPVTAYFSAIPGGLQEMVLTGSAFGGDARILSLTHAARILFVVMTIPFGFSWLFGYVGGAGRSLLIMPAPTELAILAATALVGLVVGKRVRLPAAALVGPMLASASVHLAGWSHAAPPGILVAVAQVVIGTGLGARFTGLTVNELVRIIGYSLLATPVLLGTTLGMAWAVHGLVGLPLPGLVLAYAPGGLAEMSLIALFLQIDTVFVSAHHIVRVVMVVLIAPAVFRALHRWRR